MKSKKITIKNINNILMYILVWFIIFTSALNYTHLPFYFSYLKDIIIFYFSIYLIKNKFIKKPENIGISFYVLFFLIISISWIGIINGTDNSTIEIIIRILRYLEFFLLFFIFTNLESICTLSYDKLIKWYIVLSILLVFVHLFGYFVPNNIVSIYIDNKIGNGFYRNRISIGQPAISVYPMLISYMYLLIYSKNDKKKIINYIILLFGIIISISTTGIISIIITSILSLVFFKNARKKILNIFLASIIIFGVALTIISRVPSLNEIYQKQHELLSIKISSLYRDNITDLSMKTRDDNYIKASSNVDNPFKRIIGVGLLGYNSNGIKVGSLENTYRMMYLCYGVLGIVSFILFILKHLIYGIKNIKYDYGIFTLSLFIIFAIHSYTLEVFYLPTISYSLSLFYCYVRRKNNNIINSEMEGMMHNESINY